MPLPDKIPLSESFEYDGVWWLPETPKTQIPGKLIFDLNDGIYLELTGSFEAEEDTWDDSQSRFRFIHGLTTIGGKWTLLESIRVNWNHSTPGLYHQRIRSQFALNGHHFSSVDEISFVSFAISFENLEEWVGKSPFNIKILKDENRNHELKGYDINFVRPNPVEIPIKCKNGTLLIRSAFNSEQDRFKSLKVKNESFIVFRANEPKNLDWFLKLFFDIERLLILLMGQVTHPRKIEGYLRNKDSGDKKRVIIFKTLYSDATTKTLFDFKMLLPLSEIETDLPLILETWLTNAEHLRSTYDLFFASFYRPNVYLETKFLTLMRALESFHRSTKHGNYLPQEEYKEIYDHLVSSIPMELDKDFKQSLKAKFKYGNEYSLRKRIKELFSELSEDLIQFVTEDKNAFLNQIVDWRNDLTHYDIETTQTIDFQAVMITTQSLRTFVMILLLKSLKIDDDTIKQRLSKVNKWRSIG